MVDQRSTWEMKGRTIIKHFDSDSDLLILYYIATEPGITIKSIRGKWFDDEILIELLKHQDDVFTCYYDSGRNCTVCMYIYFSRSEYVDLF